MQHAVGQDILLILLLVYISYCKVWVRTHSVRIISYEYQRLVDGLISQVVPQMPGAKLRVGRLVDVVMKDFVDCENVSILDRAHITES